MPYFSLVHPARGVVQGPYSKLRDSTLRRLALDVASVLEGDSSDSVDNLFASVDRAVESEDEHMYWCHIRRRGHP